MNRRDFLKLGGLSPLLLFRRSLQDGFDIQAAFRDAGEAGVVDIPPGVHPVTDTLVATNYMTVRGNNAILSPIGDFTGKPVLDLSGAKYGNFNQVRILAGENDTAFAGVLMGRSAQGDGAGHVLTGCTVQGRFTGAGLYNQGAEGYALNSCNLVTDNDRPAMWVDGPVAFGQHNNCAFRNYSGLEGVSLIELHQTLSALAFEQNTYFFVGKNGIAISVRGTASTGKIHDCRVEGEGAGCLLLDNQDFSTLYQWNIARVNYTPKSDYVIRTTNKHLHECVFDFMAGCNAVRYIHATGTAKVWRCRIYGNKRDWVTLSGTAQTRMNHLFWSQGAPVMIGPNDNLIHTVN